MRKGHLTVFALLFSLSLALAQSTDFHMAQIYPVERSHSYVGFSIKYMGYAMVKGRFANFDGTIRYDENDLSKTSVSFMVDVASIDTDNDWRDGDLKSDNWFDAETYPQMTFVSQRVEETDGGFNVIGDLTIKDVTKSVTIKMEPPSGVLKDVRGDKQVIFNGSFTINRKEYGVAGENWSKIKEGIAGVGDEAHIELIILGKQIQEANFRNRMGNPERPHNKIYQAAANDGVAAALQIFQNMKAQADEENPVSPNTLNIAAYMLLKEGKYDRALPLFEANMKAFPDNANVYDSYAEALAWSGKLKEANKYYQMAAEKDPANWHAREILRHLNK